MNVLIQILTILAPLVEEIADAMKTGKLPEFVSRLPDKSRARIALEARKAGIK
jgi:hypothetical protein